MRKELVTAAVVSMLAVVGVADPALAARPSSGGPSATVTLTVDSSCTFTATASWFGYDVHYVWLDLLGQVIQVRGNRVFVLRDDANGVDATASIAGTTARATWTTAPTNATNRFYANTSLFAQDPATGAQPLVQVWSSPVRAACALPAPN